MSNNIENPNQVNRDNKNNVLIEEQADSKHF